MLKTLIYALIFVAPIYCVFFFELFDKDPYPWLCTLLALGSVVVFLIVPSKRKFWFGFFVSLFWFYWVGFSFVYFNATFLVPFIALAVACIYMILFAFALYFPFYWWRGLWLLLLSFIHPFGFDWLVVDSFFAYSYFGVQKYEFALVVLGIGLILQKQNSRLLLGFVFLLCAIKYKMPLNTQNELDFKYTLLSTNFSQDFKWQRQNIQSITKNQIDSLQKAINEGNKMIVLPETAFPFEIEKSYFWNILKEMSKETTLIIGSLRETKGGIYNSAYIFSHSHVDIADKKILAPFGEQIPLPDILAQKLYKFFFGNSPKMIEGDEFRDIEIEGKKMRILICYEGTSAQAYIDAPKYLVVISNNAWFKGSIQSSVQKMLFKYYAKRFDKIILHSSNGSRSFTITP